MIRQELNPPISEIERLSKELEDRYIDRLNTDNFLSRGLVSFQANKSRTVYRWYKFKEAFSAALVEYVLERYGAKGGALLDPFAGSGTALFASSRLGFCAQGIELLPIGHRLIETKKLIDGGLTKDELATLKKWSTLRPWRHSEKQFKIPELRITKGAYPADTEASIGKFLSSIHAEGDRVASVLFFALLCITEQISFTRKDGQYLRWDYRSERRQGTNPFNKGEIPSFDDAMSQKLMDIVSDLNDTEGELDLFSSGGRRGNLTLHLGSCLNILPTMPAAHFDCIVTSPPYCNRYDYTRTYALELALLDVDENRLRSLRQDMLSCTVENRRKDLLSISSNWNEAISVVDNQELLQTILAYLSNEKDNGSLNNNGIPRMITGYFYEMACVIYECARVLKPGTAFIMVNDNVRYAGVSIPVDLILSEIAASLGFTVESIMVLPNGKGNSSQQMGTHGRDRLRKCVYVWKRNLTVERSMPHIIHRPYREHLSSEVDLHTDYPAYRAGFVALVLERNRRATPFVDEARKLKALASEAKTAADLQNMYEIRSALLTAAGVSDKAANHLEEPDKADAITSLIANFLEPAGASFVEELVFRFLLTRGDSLGGSMRNIGGALAQRKLTRSIISFLNLGGIKYRWADRGKKWIDGESSIDDADIEINLRGLSWENKFGKRTLIYNLTVPVIKNNVDMCLFDSSHAEYSSSDVKNPERYLALGELKGGIDPAGADEHWKTARSALERIHRGFADYTPATFFVGAAIERKMAREIWDLLEVGTITNAANLTDERQVSSVSRWLCTL